METKIKLKTLLIILILCFLFSCKTNIEDPIKVTELSTDKSEGESTFSSYFKLRRIIKLETNEGCTIGEIGRVVFTKDKILVVDDLTKGIFVFNYSGNFLFKINKPGKGPGEYISIGDVYVDENEGMIYILDKSVHKIIKYSLEGTFESEKTSKYPISEFLKIDNSYIYYFRNSSNSDLPANNNEHYYNLIFEKEGKIIFKSCPFNKGLSGHFYHVRYANVLA